MFSHEKLNVYTKALDFVTRTSVLIGDWDKKHAFVDHLSRASESILLNLAQGARHRNGPMRLQLADCAIGSTLECAACLDIAHIKALLQSSQLHEEKLHLFEITKMLYGLRKAWNANVLREETSDSTVASPKPEQQMLFNHERLDVYRTALDFVRWFFSRPEASNLSNRLFREIDEAGTSVVLNIAEGNGRFAELDHHRFLQIAQNAAVKADVYLDLCVRKALLSDIAEGKNLLRRISDMVEGF
ncbi:MAG: hypothetical protein C5B50_22020 [Verrucomicrobia bacterium]|nr:MAG: hypothetical protein C5B50_22020 [Verrucomicrobiota bacterium]